MRRIRRLVVLCQGHTQTDTKGDGDDDEQDDEGAPPLELAAATGVFVGLLDLLIALFDVFDCVNGICLCGFNDGILLFNHGREFLVEKGDLREGLLDALQLVMSGANIAEDGAGMTGTVGPQLLEC